MLGLIGGIGVQELVLIFAIVLLLFGARRLPEIARSMGKGIREFKGALKDEEPQEKSTAPKE